MDCVNDGTSWTVVCKPGAVGTVPVVIRNARFCQKMLFSINGFENFVQCECSSPHCTAGLVKDVSKVASCISVSNPAGRKLD